MTNKLHIIYKHSKHVITTIQSERERK